MRTVLLAETKCEACGKVETRPAYKSKHRRFCSWTCRDVGGTKPKVQIQCSHCKKELNVAPHRASQKFCSKECKRIGETTVGRGNSRKTEDGYITVYWPSHPRAGKKGYIPEHRIVAEEKYGRPLTKGEHVHHLNGIRDDNRPENLVVLAAREHLILTRKEDNQMRAELARYRQIYGPLPSLS